MRVLLVDHTGLVSGAERSLLTLAAHLGEGVECVLACPPGPLTTLARAQGLEVCAIRGMDGSLRLHPRHTPRALADLVRGAVAVRAAARRVRADVVHANSVRAGIIAVAAGAIGGPPVVAHVRDCLPPGAVATVTRRLLSAGAATLVANSHHTAKAFDAARPPVVVHSPVELDAFDPARHDRVRARRALGVRADQLVLAVVGQLTQWKGQDLAIDALRRVRASCDAHLLLVGEAKFVAAATRFDNRAYEARLHAASEQGAAAGAVTFTGEREDVAAVLAAVDLLLVPSWEEPLGRVAIEALAMGVPVLATSVGGTGEVVEEGVTGRLLAPRDPEAWATAIIQLAGDPGLRSAMGARGPAAAARFGPEPIAHQVRRVYEDVLRDDGR